MTVSAPRGLNEPVRWKSSSFSTTRVSEPTRGREQVVAPLPHGRLDHEIAEPRARRAHVVEREAHSGAASPSRPSSGSVSGPFSVHSANFWSAPFCREYMPTPA